MITAVLHPNSYEYFLSITQAAPIRLLTPPSVWLTPPSVSALTLKQQLDEMPEDNWPTFKSKFAIFRHILNPRLSIPGFYGSFLFEDNFNLLNLLDEADLAVEGIESYAPHALFVYDGMVSKASRSYLKSVSESFFKNALEWNLFVADENNPKHKFLFDNFNPEASNQLKGSEMFSF